MDGQQYSGVPAGSPAQEIRGGFSGVLRATEKAVQADVAPGHSETLTGAMEALAAGQDAVDLAAARLAARVRETGALAGCDHSTVVGLLRGQGRSLAQAKAVVLVGENLDRFTDSVKAAEAGEIAFSKLAQIVASCEKAADGRPTGLYPDEAEFRGKAEAVMLQAARGGVAESGLRRIGRTLIERISPETHEERHRRAFEERKAVFTRSALGFHLGVQGDVASEHIIASALDLHRAAPREGDERTSGERVFDALVQLCENRIIAEGHPVPKVEEGSDAAKALAAPRPQGGTCSCSCGAHGGKGRGKGSGRAFVNVTVPLDTLQGKDGAEPAVTDRGRILPPSVARAFASDCVLQRIVTEPVTGRVLDVGTARRIFPGKVRRVLAARSATCQWEEGCSTPVRWCEADHRTEWWEGGSTSVDNGQVLCGRHNREKHRRRAEAHYRSRRPGRGRRVRRRREAGEGGPDPPGPPNTG